jgi:hypothetical protein
MMKRYLLFAGHNYYPSGGWEDYILDFNTEDEAMQYFKDNNKTKSSFHCWGWMHIVDRDTLKITTTKTFERGCNN